MASSKKEPPNPSKDRPTRRSSNLSSVPSSGYGARRTRSVPGSPDRKYSLSASEAATSSVSSDTSRPSLLVAGRSVSSRSMSSGSSIHGSKPYPAAASKSTLGRVKSDKASERPSVLSAPASNSSTSLKGKLASPKWSTRRAPSPVPVRGGKSLPVSSARAPIAATKKRAEAAVGGAAASSRAKAIPPSPRAVEPPAAREEKEEDEPSMQFEESDSLSSPSIEDHLHEQLPDPVDLMPTSVAAPDSAQRDYQQQTCSENLEQQDKHEKEVIVEHLENENAGESLLHFNGGQGADDSGEDKADTIEVAADEPEQVEKEDEPKAEQVEKQDEPKSEQVEKQGSPVNKTLVVQSWKKDDLKSNDVIEETKSKLLEERKSRVRALVGAFETVMSKD